MKLVFALYYSHIENDFGLTDGGTSFGHKLLEPIVRLRARLEDLGFEVLTHRQHPLGRADIVIVWDLDQMLWQEVLSVPLPIPCILICTESPIYAPLSYDMNVLFHKRWAAVLTWNRSFEADHIHYYDIPIAGATFTETEPGQRRDNMVTVTGKGVTVSSYKQDPRGLALKRDDLYVELARQGYIDLYGANWPIDAVQGIHGPTSDKIETIRQYSFSLISENSIYPGYVTEKLADSILAGIPAIYYGDFKSAERRFPGTFVCLPELSVPCFLEARKELITNYEHLQQNVIACLKQSNRWSDSFLNMFVGLIQKLAGKI